MSTTVDFIEYVCKQIEGIGVVRYRKMFGEYMVYVNDKPVLIVCDNTVYVKKLPELEELLANAELGYPYKGAREHYILEIENADLSRQVVAIAETIIPLPKSKKPKAN